MNSSRLGWLVVEGIFLSFFLYFGNSLALGLSLVLILIPLGSMLMNLYVKKHISIDVTTQTSVRKGENGIVMLTIGNHAMIPMFKVRCRIQTENQLNKETEKQDIFTWIPAKKTRRISLNVGSAYCGRICCKVFHITLYDCFGVIGIRKKIDSVGYMTVLPDTFEMNLSLVPTPGSIEESELYSQVSPGYDLTEIFQIREYVPGDSPRQIHWKLSSKFDKLIVKDPALPITRNVLLFWERTGESGDFALIDAQAETLVSICRNLLEQSVQFIVGWNDTKLNQCVMQKIHDMDELIGILPRILRASGSKDGISGAELLLQTSQNALGKHIVYLAEEPQSNVLKLQQYGHVAMLLCGKTELEGALMFDAKHYQEQLREIEL